MKRYFAPIYDGDFMELEHLPRIYPSKGQFYSDNADWLPKIVMEIDEDRFFLVPTIDTQSEKVIGYVMAEKKYGKLQKGRQDDVARFDNKSAPSLVTKGPHGTVIGYLQTSEKSSYIAVTRPQPIIPILLLPLFLVTVMVCVYFFWAPTLPPVANTDGLINGGLTPTIAEQLDPAYFNIKINATPIIKDGSMNIRIENSDRNIYDCMVTVGMMLGDTSEIIYTSPLISPDQALEYATIGEDYPSGVYDGKANFKFFADDGSLLGNATVSLTINIF